MFKSFERTLGVMSDSDWHDLTGGAALPEVAELESTDLLDELSHRIRGPLLRRLRIARSAAELAAELDVPVTRLYHHLNALESAGLIEVVATRRVGAALERRYRAVARGFRVGPDAVQDPRDLARALGAVVDTARADLVGSVESGAGDEVAIWSMRLRLPPPERTELVDRINELLAEFRERSVDATDVEEFVVFTIAFPAENEAPPHGPGRQEK
jgi:DNA-binding transcriptional ArsR family regulator